MGDSNTGMLDPSDNQGPFGFAFNDIDFSDRVLHVEIIEEPLDSRSDHDGDAVLPNRKRKRENPETKNDETAGSRESDCAVTSVVVKVKTYHINSAILAAKSPFFYKLFKNGMRESQQRNATLRINASEEAALMDLMKYMYTDTLSAATASDLLGVLLAADKFEVTSCVKYCSYSLLKLPMSLKSAILYLDLPTNVFVGEVIHPLVDAAKHYLLKRYRDFNKSKKKMMGMPLCAIEVLFGGGLKVDYEDDFFDFILKWACEHYPKLEERQEILAKLMVRYIRFSTLTCLKLKEALASPNFSHEEVHNHLLQALFLKCGAPYSRQPSLDTPLRIRVYKLRSPIKVVKFKFANELHCDVYFDITKVEFLNQFVSPMPFQSESFFLGGRMCFLSAGCSLRQPNKFGLFLHMKRVSEAFTLNYEFAVRQKPSKEFKRKMKAWADNSKFPGNSTYPSIGKCSLFGNADIMSIDRKYFIDEILHLRVSLALKAPQA